MSRPRKLIAELLLLPALLVAMVSGEDTGSVCVAPMAKPSSGEKSLANPSGGNPIRSYTVQIDNRPAIEIASDHAVAISSLRLSGRHLVRVKGDGKNITAFHFRFDKSGGPNLCLLFKPLYETWSLMSAKGHGKDCVCP